MTRLSPDAGLAVVTGAGSGLGRAICIELAGRGFTVAGLGRRVAALEKTAAAAGKGVHPVPCDIADPAAVRNAFETVAALGDPILLINNAAVYPHRDVLEESGESFMETVAVNLGGTFNCSRAALEIMARTGKGRILNVSTFADLYPLPSAGAYSVSKGAARILTRSLIADLGDRFPGIVIGDWMPGQLATGMGIPDGLDPTVSARLGVELALRCDPDLTGTVFEMDTEVPQPRGLKRKIADALMLRRARPRRL